MAIETIVPGDRVPPPRPVRNEALWASLGPFLLALCYLRVLMFPGFPVGVSGLSLTKLLQIEFLVIHSFPFLAVIGNIKGSDGKRPPFMKYFFWFVFALYLLVASTRGWEGLVIFVAATLATYLGFWFQRFEPMALANLAGRWVLGFAIYLAFISFFDLPRSVDHWRSGPDVYLSGFWYFLVLGLLELMGFYSMPFWEKFKKFLASAESSGHRHG